MGSKPAHGEHWYPPILSAVIKVARFIVVQQALELSEPLSDDEFDSDSSDPRRRRRKGCLQLVKKMMD
jgi:hypothetical protein